MNAYSSFILGLSLTAASISATGECDLTIQASTPTERFVIQTDSTVIDTATGLMWKRCAEGAQWNGTTCEQHSEVPTEYSWQDALTQAVDHQFASYEDWRLPNKLELASIVEYSCFEPAINADVFPNTSATSFWSNTPNNFNVSFAWAINFMRGEHTTTGRTHLFGVRLVRDFGDR